MIANRLLATGTDSTDLGSDYFEQRQRDQREKRLIRELERLGNKVTVDRAAA